MYTQFFQLKQAPFSIAPDPRYLFMSDRHREALAHLLYGVGGGGGFVLLTGEIGAGKTTVCRCLLEQIPDKCHVAYIFNPKLSVNELLQSICDEFHIASAPGITGPLSAKNHVDALNAYLLRSHAEGKNNVLIIDEAQNLAPDVLEQLRLLTNLETSERKLLQVILIGQPELRAMLARPELEQLAQRVIARYHLGPLSLSETAGYIHYRLSIAGAIAVTPFPASLMAQIHRLSRGIPRRINLLCDRALLGAYAANRTEVTSAIIDKAAREVFGGKDTPLPGIWRRWRIAAAGAGAGAAVAGSIAWAIGHYGWAWDSAAPAIAAQQSAFKLSHSLSDRGAARWRLSDSLGDATAPTLATTLPRSGKPSVLMSAAAGQAIPTGTPISDLNHLFSPAMRDELVAYQLLGQLWGIALKQQEPCLTAQSRNVLCYRSRQGLAELRRLNRPAILELYDQQNAKHYALLMGLTHSFAVLRIAGTMQNIHVGLTDLERHFSGEFVTFWRAPPGFNLKIGFGDKGESVDWLGAQLTKLNGSIETISGQPFGSAMARQLREFQTAQDLQADGIAGPQTLMLLNAAAGVNEPRLYVNQTLAAAVPRK